MSEESIMKLGFHEENAMYAQVALQPNTLLRNGAYGIVMRDVQKCTPRVHRYGIEISFRYVVSFTGRQPK